MRQTSRWSITVSADTDRRVRRFLDAAGRKGDLSKYVEEVIRANLLEAKVKTEHRRPSANEVELAAEEPAPQTERHYGS